ncbi:MAG TPA: hypothetical protein VIF09_05040, partial [Polyangiaceae bacterium]
MLALGACAVPASESSDRAAQDLWVATSSGTQAWNRTIPICFAQSSLLLNDHTREKNIIQNAITRTWLHAANIPATWTNACPTTGGGQHLRIQLGLHTSYDGQTDGQTSPEGMSTLSADGPEDPNLQNPGIRLWIQDDGHSG